MRLNLFNFIDETINIFERNNTAYKHAVIDLEQLFSAVLRDKKECVIAINSRIKSKSSLKEKLIRNKFYLNYKSPEEALDHLADLIGITIQCRFIRNEADLYAYLFRFFERNGHEYFRCNINHSVYLDLNMFQPQLQRNGFTIYRIDGYYLLDGQRINFELQIKSLVHQFWSEIEHEVVYKNPDFVMYDSFNRNMLGAIRDNLDIVDRQLEIMHNEISYESSTAQIGMDERGFKVFVSRSINELVNRKMKESVGFTTDFKKCSAMIAQYIYVNEFLNGEHNRYRMIEYLELLNFLSDTKIDFSEEISLEHPYTSPDPFCSIIGDYFLSQMNVNFQWHVFFAMLFTIHPGNNHEDFTDFCHVIRILLIQPGWYNERFASYSAENAEKVRLKLETVLAEALCDVNRIEIVHEDKLYDVMTSFRRFCEEIEENYDTFSSLKDDLDMLANTLYHQIVNLFH